jgi:hypothetical protein
MPSLVCDSFKLTFVQNFTDPATGTFDTNRFKLDVFDENGDHYTLPTATIPKNPDLICLLLRRMANAQAQTGWKFDGTFTAPGPGVITG